MSTPFLYSGFPTHAEGQAAGIDMSSQDRLWSGRDEIRAGLQTDLDAPAPFDLQSTIDDVASDLTRRSNARSLTLNVRYALNAPRFLIGHGDRIRQVMTKLVGHAIELATLLNPRGRVAIDVQGDECSDGCASMRLRVEVAGQGMPGGKAPIAAVPTSVPIHLRTQLARPRQDHAELGLVATLADCRRLVELMGGRLGALTDPAQGSFVWLAMKLPVDASRRRQLR